MFSSGNPFSWIKLTHMNANCTVCGQSFDLEPGFYWGAMYVSYALSVGIIVPAGFFFAYALEWSDLLSIIAATALLVLLLPAIYRYSRVVWLYFFVRYSQNNSQ